MPENGNVELFQGKEVNNSHDVHISASTAEAQETALAATGNGILQLKKDMPQSQDESPSHLFSKEIFQQNSNEITLNDSENINENATKISSLSSSPQSRKGMTVLGETQEIVVEEETYQGHKKDYEPVPSTLLPPLDEPVPDNWISLDGEFVLVCGVYQTHLGPDMLAAPDAHLNDGFIHLMMVREGISRNALLNLFLSFGEGAQMQSPHVETVKVLAMRLEPESDQGNLMIDGERFDPSPCQAQILPGVAKVMAIK